MRATAVVVMTYVCYRWSGLGVTGLLDWPALRDGFACAIVSRLTSIDFTLGSFVTPGVSWLLPVDIVDVAKCIAKSVVLRFRMLFPMEASCPELELGRKLGS